MPFKASTLLTPSCLAFCVASSAFAADEQAAGAASKLQLLDISAITQVAFGGTSGDERGTRMVTGSAAHDPRRDGFDFQTLELSISGQVDPFFKAAAFMAVSEDEGIELEEALSGNHWPAQWPRSRNRLMLTEFGRYNPVHSHYFAHIDKPLVIGTMFG